MDFHIVGLITVNSVCYIVLNINIFSLVTLVLCFENIVTPSAICGAGVTRPLSV
jgi:hypothetical protein